MFDQILVHPIFGPTAVLLLSAAGGAVVAWITRWRARSEHAAAQERQQAALTALTQQMALDKLTHESMLERLRMEAELAEVRRQDTVRADADRLRLETAQAQQIIAESLEKTTTAHREALAAQAQKLDDMAIVQDQTHAAVNSAKTALESMLQAVRNELKVVETAAAHAATVAALELQATRDRAQRELVAKEAQVAALLRQLAQQAAPPLPGQAPPLPSPLAPEQASGPQVVVIPATDAQSVPVEEASRIVLP